MKTIDAHWGPMNALLAALWLLSMVLVSAPALAECNPAPLVGLCIGQVTANEGTFAEGTCEDGSSFEYTQVRYAHSYGVAVEVLGAHECRGAPGQYAYENGGVVVHASAAPGNGVPGTFAAVQHYETTYTAGGSTSTTCHTGAAATGAGQHALGCPAGGVPNPGWGHLLP